MAFRRFRYRRTRSSRYFRKPRYSRSVRSRRYRYRRRYARKSSTKTGVVKLTFESSWLCNYGGTDDTWNAFSFVATALPGFSEYLPVFSRFRILKAYMDIARNSGTTSGTTTLNEHYLVVPSRTFARTTAPADVSGPHAPDQAVPPQKETALRQTRWQREIRPSDVKPYVRVGFKPYCMVGTYGPCSSAQAAYYRVHEGSRWMPMSWTNDPQRPISFFGPYIAISNNLTNTSPEQPSTNYTINLTLTLYCQFCGQV